MHGEATDRLFTIGSLDLLPFIYMHCHVDEMWKDAESMQQYRNPQRILKFPNHFHQVNHWVRLVMLQFFAKIFSVMAKMNHSSSDHVFAPLKVNN